MANQQKDQRKVSSTGPDQEPAASQNMQGADNPAQSMMGTDGDNKLKTSATDLLQHAKETANDSYEAVATKAKSSLEQRKGEFSAGLKTVADSVRQIGGQLKNAPENNPVTDLTSQYTGKAAGALEQVANYFERKDLRAIMRDTEDFARRNPAVFFGTAFALGLLAARFLKSSSPDRMSVASGMQTGRTPQNTSPTTAGNQPRGAVSQNA
jgi:ElaB/YqjD/DUF883 family membrane-anchored ribosome-binding protein